ncbi:hypothetical protein G6F43_009357 [Rhizopus delemar]|nr:hypothetical protein G6F43_009357 [Rhizopus delemar]
MSESLEQLQKLAEEMQQLGTLVERKHIQDLANTVVEENRKRVSTRISTQKSKIIKPSARDALRIPNIEVTLGSNLLHLGNTIEITGKKSRYFSFLSKNSVLNLSISIPSSQIKLLCDPKREAIVEYYEQKTKKIRNPKTVEVALHEVENYATNRNQIKFKRIYIHM